MNANTAIFWPMIAQTALIFAIYFLMSRRRVGAVKAGTAKTQDFKIPWIEPDPSATVARSLINQFELPMLFYIVCILLNITSGATYLALAVAWLFVISRCIHAFVHVTSNRLMLRRRLFMLGFACVVVLWVLFAVHIAFP